MRCRTDGCPNRPLHTDPLRRCYSCLAGDKRLRVEKVTRVKKQRRECLCGCGQPSGTWLFVKGHAPADKRKVRA